MNNNDNKTDTANSVSLITKGVITARSGVVLSSKLYDYGWSDDDCTRETYDNTLRYTDGLACVHLNGKYGFVDLNGEEVVPPSYDYAADFSEGLACVLLDSEFGYINNKGIVAVPFRNYDWRGAFNYSVLESP